MSNFIKVNFKYHSLSAVLKKSNIELFKEGNCNSCNDKFYCKTIVTRIEELIAAERMNCSYYDICKRSEITREEYDRLCKELGVKDAV